LEGVGVAVAVALLTAVSEEHAEWDTEVVGGVEGECERLGSAVAVPPTAGEDVGAGTEGEKDAEGDPICVGEDVALGQRVGVSGALREPLPLWRVTVGVAPPPGEGLPPTASLAEGKEEGDTCTLALREGLPLTRGEGEPLALAMEALAEGVEVADGQGVAYSVSVAMRGVPLSVEALPDAHPLPDALADAHAKAVREDKSVAHGDAELDGDAVGLPEWEVEVVWGRDGVIVPLPEPQRVIVGDREAEPEGEPVGDAGRESVS
jgi:hypothetical protein